VKVLEGVTFDITRWFDDDHFFKQVQITDPNNTNASQVFTERVARFSPGDFTNMLSYQGMQVQDVFGDYELSQYDIRKSPRMIIIAKKLR
jgi:hypothetical protein